jgi:tetratricopeptide (TPR) repeat protein
MKKAAQRRGPSDRAIGLLLLAAALVTYSQVYNYAFISFDDKTALLENPHVCYGFSWSGIAWAFTSAYAANWFPLTWLSHMLDFQLFGWNSGWHHLTNALIHAVSSALLFALMKRMTGRAWESAFVGFVFALHPLHVESVAWISERKDVLFAFFWFLTTWLYLDFLEKRTAAKYLLMVGAFSLGLMSKQMIVTLPFALLLLDWWPLKRHGVRTWLLERTLLEKAPLVALAGAASAITWIAQQKGDALRSLALIPLTLRLETAFIAYVAYLRDFIWPAGLVFFYPYPAALPAWEVVCAVVAIAAVSVFAGAGYRQRPYLAVGWFWYLGTLVPVIGLIQVGYQSRADRYTYVPLIGISIMMAWAAAEVWEKWPRARTAIQAAAVVACCGWWMVTWKQIQYWRDSPELYHRAVAVSNENYMAHYNLGLDMVNDGHLKEGVRELYIAVEQNPSLPRHTLGVGLDRLGQKEEAIEQLRQSIRLHGDDAEAHANMGEPLTDLGRLDEAIREYNTALRMSPALPNAYYGMGCVLLKQDRPKDAIAYFSQALRLNPGFTEARERLRQLGAFQ